MTTLSIIYRCELCDKGFYRKRDAEWHVCNEHDIISEEVVYDRDVTIIGSNKDMVIEEEL